MGNCNKVIKMLAGASSPEKFCYALKQCRIYIKDSVKDCEKLLEEIKRILGEKAGHCKPEKFAAKSTGHSDANISIYCDMAAYYKFSFFYIGYCKNASGLDVQIEYLVDFFEKCMSKPRGGILDICEVKELLSIVQKKYDLFSAVACSRELEIFIINRSHICYDSFLLTFKNMHTGIWVNKWLLFCLSPCMDITVCNRYFVFLHEIGHILFNAITEKGENIPEMFGEISFLLGLPKTGDDKADELFADIFSASVLQGTRYEDHNPFKNILSQGFYEFLELYFKMLVMKLNRYDSIYAGKSGSDFPAFCRLLQ